MARRDAEKKRYSRCDVASAGFPIGQEPAQLGHRFSWVTRVVAAAATTIAKLDYTIAGGLVI